MTPLQDTLRTRLEAERRRLQARLADNREEQELSKDAIVESVDTSDLIGADLRVADALGAQFREALDAVEQALARIDDPMFGRCGDCGESIPIERLLMVPETQMCVTCQSRAGQQRRA